jgi:phage regulator Rha-like protein
MDNLIQFDTTSIISFIYIIRGERVLLDSDLAKLYGVETKMLKRAIKRNIIRFPSDFMFELTASEYTSLRYHFGTLKNQNVNVEKKDSLRGKHSKYPPFAFTEQGVAMLSSVLNSERAINVNIAIMRAFVKVREIIYSNNDLARKISELEKLTNEKFKNQDKKIGLVFEAIKSLIKEKSSPKNPLGFEVPGKEK